jgi:uncharacterized membrane protein YfcA
MRELQELYIGMVTEALATALSTPEAIISFQQAGFRVREVTVRPPPGLCSKRKTLPGPVVQLDAVGGGAWGPVVTSTLLGTGEDPRKAIGTTNTAEFFVALSVSFGFLVAIVTGHWDGTGLDKQIWSVAGLIAGGIVTAPIAGWTTKVLPLRSLTWAVGILVVVLAGWQGYVAFAPR